MNRDADASGSDNSVNSGTGSSDTSSRPVVTNLKITAGKHVECLWPNAKLPILRATADPGTVLLVTSDSATDSYTLKSNVNLRGGEIFYFQRSFYIREGTLTFDEDETHFNPMLTVRAETRDMMNNEMYTISLLVDNQPLLSFTPRLESSPSLSRVEILNLMGDSLAGVGGSGTYNSNASARAVVSSLSDLALQFGVINTWQQRVRNFLHLDVFSFRTQMLQNAIINNLMPMSTTKGTATGSTVEGSNTNTGAVTQKQNIFGTMIDNTSIMAGKFIGPDMYVQGMLMFSYDPNYSQLNGVRIIPDLSVELKTPYFNIAWNLDVVSDDRQNLWLNDNKITISRRWLL
jgi:hypothetical protein